MRAVRKRQVKLRQSYMCLGKRALFQQSHYKVSRNGRGCYTCLKLHLTTLAIKAIASEQGMLANFQNNAQPIDWVNEQRLAQPVVCLGDGHLSLWRSEALGIWNIISQIATPRQRLEILDWYHPVENLHKVGGSIKQLHQAEACYGKVKLRQQCCAYLNGLIGSPLHSD